jgi:integrase
MMPKKLPKGVSKDLDRHKNWRFYFRAPGRPKIRLREEPGTKAFDDEVSCARLGIPYEKPAPVEKRKIGAPAKENSFQWLVQQYKTRAKNRLNPEQLARRVRLLEEICDSGKKKRRGALPYKLMDRKHVLEIRDTIRTSAGAQNNVVKTISAMFGWAISVGLADRNPAIGIEHLYSGDGFHAWTVDEVRQYEARHPLGSTARLALHLGLFTGLRLSDLAILGRQHVRDGWLYVRPRKTGKSSGVVVEIPVLPELQVTIDASEIGDLTFLINELKRPFTVNGLGNKMRQWCDQADLPQCSMHGLRKAGATIAADNGATDSQLMAIFGWTTKKQTTLYTKKADRKRLAQEAIRKLVPEQKMDRIVPPKKRLAKSGTKMPKKAIKSTPR